MYTKRGNSTIKIYQKMTKIKVKNAIVELDGFVGSAEIFVFSDVFNKYQSLLIEDND